MTIHELSLLLDSTQNSVAQLIRREGTELPIHIYGWEKPPKGRGRNARIYGYGKKKDKREPKPITKQEYERNYYRRNKEREALVSRGGKLPVCRLNNPFGVYLGVQNG